MRRVIFLFFLVLISCPVQAQEFYLLGGVAGDPDTSERSYSWQLEYMQEVGEHFAASLSYLNEGHLPDHHRDGNTLQGWMHTRVLDQRLSLAAGAGPYYYFDTTKGTTGGLSANDHGWGGMLSLAATWYTDSRWLFQLRTNWVGVGRSFDTLSAVAGIGYQLESPSLPEQHPKEPSRLEKTTNNEITMFLGQTIVNDFKSTHDVAMSIEYRRGLWRYLDWTVAWLYEGDERLIRRNGVTTQLWAVRPFFGDRLALGVGGGAYFAIDRYHDLFNGNGGSKLLSGIFTLTGSYRIHPRWDVRTSWSRLITTYNMDTDVILGGIGYRF